jgi:D-arginine dehydrogenase
LAEIDVVVVGGGIAGVSIAYELSADRSVTLLEAESTLAYHTTGRSAATFLETYGGPDIRALTAASRDFYEDPPAVFDRPLLRPLPLVFFARRGRGAAADELYEATAGMVAGVERLDAAQVAEVTPFARADALDGGVFEPGARELDVHAIHQGYVKGLRDRGGAVVRDARVTALRADGDGWLVTTADRTVRAAGAVVNAAGAWADLVAALAGVAPVGLRPLLRTVFLIEPPVGLAPRGLPMFADLDDSFYVKPESGGFLCSPADETPVEPHDARADEVEIARAIEAINETTTLAARSVGHRWAGLRSFVPDRRFVLGEDPAAPGFFWCAGQGGYGIQTAPAAARLGAALVRGERTPADLAARGVDAALVAPRRPGIGIPGEAH